MPETPGPTNAVEVRFRSFWEVKVDHDVDGLDVDTAGEQICNTSHIPDKKKCDVAWAPVVRAHVLLRTGAN